jgi:hypothetical protein
MHVTSVANQKVLLHPWEKCARKITDGNSSCQILFTKYIHCFILPALMAYQDQTALRYFVYR